MKIQLLLSSYYIIIIENYTTIIITYLKYWREKNAIYFYDVKKE